MIVPQKELAVSFYQYSAEYRLHAVVRWHFIVKAAMIITPFANPVNPMLNSSHIEAFLTHLAVSGHVAASTQNQALAALFLYYTENRIRTKLFLDTKFSTKIHNEASVQDLVQVSALPKSYAFILISV